jgi:hypothetical protein
VLPLPELAYHCLHAYIVRTYTYTPTRTHTSTPPWLIPTRVHRRLHSSAPAYLHMGIHA